MSQHSLSQRLTYSLAQEMAAAAAAFVLLRLATRARTSGRSSPFGYCIRPRFRMLSF